MGAASYMINASRICIIWFWNVVVWFASSQVYIPRLEKSMRKKTAKNSKFRASPSKVCQKIMESEKMNLNMDFMLKG